jgi:hypothetical protein
MSSFESTPVESTSIVKCESCNSDITLENITPCDRCKVSGCYECVKTECCDCSIVMCRACSNIDDGMCDCYGKCYTCGIEVSRGSGWPCGECRIWNCSECKKSVKNLCKECGPPPKLEKVEEVLKCESCETVITFKKEIRCYLCNREEDDESEEEYEEKDKKPHLFCKKCTLKCDACEVRGCKECVTFACCDCGYNMCYECRNNEIDCGCYGECYSCGVDVNRGEEGWPCGECEKWYCHGCRQGDNPCKECGPESESESDSDLEEEEDANLEVATNLEVTSLVKEKQE